LKRGHFRGQKRATFFSTFFRHKFPSLFDWGICGEKMMPVVLQGGPREAAKVALFESAVDTTGPLLRNSWGNPWDKDAIGHAMRRASKKAKVKGIAYGYRHGFATDALAKGIPDATVAALLGHSSTAMLHKHYSHLTSRTAVLKEAVDRIR